MDNGVPISAYTRQPNDDELLYMVSYLGDINSYPDIREHIISTFKLAAQMKKHCPSYGTS